MGERPTPEELAPGEEGRAILARLAAHGYRIVHPDDVPEFEPGNEPGTIYEGADEFVAGLDRSTGWNACRAHIFGEGA